MDRNRILQQIEWLKGLVKTADQYAATENRDSIPSLWQIHNANITIAIAELEREIRS